MKTIKMNTIETNRIKLTCCTPLRKFKNWIGVEIEPYTCTAGLFSHYNIVLTLTCVYNNQG